MQILTNEIYLKAAETHKRKRQQLAKSKIQNLFTGQEQEASTSDSQKEKRG